MNDSELNDLLQQARVPERSAEEWTGLAADTTRQLQRRQQSVPTQSRAVWPRLAWGLGLATVCVLIGFLVGQQRADRETRLDEIAQARKLFAELSETFPNQLQTVVLDGKSPQIVLADRPLTNRGTPLYVRLCATNGCQRVITFSGERVPLNGEQCDVLVDANGRVIISGERFVWSSGEQVAGNPALRIEATLLAGAL